MRHKTFLWFFLPTGLAMLLFIAMPIVSVVIQSIFAPHPAVLLEVDSLAGILPVTSELRIPCMDAWLRDPLALHLARLPSFVQLPALHCLFLNSQRSQTSTVRNRDGRARSASLTCSVSDAVELARRWQLS